MDEEQANRNSSPMKFGVVGLGIGLAVGVLAGLALAPKSGKENRQLVVNQYVKAKDATVSKFKKTKKEDDKKVVKKAPAKK